MVTPNQVTVTWPTLAVALSFVVAVTTFAIQLGSMQATVLINIQRLDRMEAALKDFRERVAKLDDIQQQINTLNEIMERRRMEIAAELRRLDQILANKH